MTLVGEEPLLPYERPPLTKGLLRGERAQPHELAIEERRLVRATTGIEVRRGVRARARSNRAPGACASTDGSELAADAIVLATGSEPARPPLPGCRSPARDRDPPRPRQPARARARDARRARR